MVPRAGTARVSPPVSAARPRRYDLGPMRAKTVQPVPHRSNPASTPAGGPFIQHASCDIPDSRRSAPSFAQRQFRTDHPVHPQRAATLHAVEKKVTKRSQKTRLATTKTQFAVKNEPKPNPFGGPIQPERTHPDASPAPGPGPSAVRPGGGCRDVPFGKRDANRRLRSRVAAQEVREGVDFWPIFSFVSKTVTNTCSKTTYGSARSADEGVGRYRLG